MSILHHRVGVSEGMYLYDYTYPHLSQMREKTCHDALQSIIESFWTSICAPDSNRKEKNQANLLSH